MPTTWPSEYAECSGEAVAGAPGALVSQPGTATTAVRLNLRRGHPSTRAEVVSVLPVGTALPYVGWVTEGEPVNGNTR